MAAKAGARRCAGSGAELPLVEVLNAADLGMAFGRDHVVHAALAPGRLARDVVALAERLAAYRRRADGIGNWGRRQDRRRRNKDNGTGTI